MDEIEHAFLRLSDDRTHSIRAPDGNGGPCFEIIIPKSDCRHGAHEARSSTATSIEKFGKTGTRRWALTYEASSAVERAEDEAVPEKRRLRAAEPSGARHAWFEDEPGSRRLHALYSELVIHRPKLAGLPPLTPKEMDRAALASAEVDWHILMALRGTEGDALAAVDRAALARAAEDPTIDLYVITIAVLAQKLALAKPAAKFTRDQIGQISDALDALTFDYRTGRKATLATLRDLRSELDERIAWLRSQREKSYRFPAKPESYAARNRKAERPDAFFRRVYLPHVPNGLTQADIRRADPAFYNVLHVWCSRHGVRLANLVPATRPRRR